MSTEVITERERAKESVREFWEASPCGSQYPEAEAGTEAYFAQLEQSRYELEPFIPSFAQFERSRGRDVLEVGFGLGTDFMQFARAGAQLHGTDLTQAAANAVRKRLAYEGLAADVRVGDAEALPFKDDSFDLVYSWGVLHHTPNTEMALSEVRRVLRPGAEARIMLYSRRSWAALGVWLRHAVRAGRPWRSFGDVIATNVESRGTKAYTSRELKQMFAAFAEVELHRYVTPYDRRVAGPLANITGNRLGWFVGIVARKQ
jgi:ubiquinone/menaquinone biosynthesis C-methylase UbiE